MNLKKIKVSKIIENNNEEEKKMASEFLFKDKSFINKENDNLIEDIENENYKLKNKLKSTKIEIEILKKQEQRNKEIIENLNEKLNKKIDLILKEIENLKIEIKQIKFNNIKDIEVKKNYVEEIKLIIRSKDEQIELLKNQLHQKEKELLNFPNDNIKSSFQHIKFNDLILVNENFNMNSEIEKINIEHNLELDKIKNRMSLYDKEINEIKIGLKMNKSEKEYIKENVDQKKILLEYENLKRNFVLLNSKKNEKNKFDIDEKSKYEYKGFKKNFEILSSKINEKNNNVIDEQKVDQIIMSEYKDLQNNFNLLKYKIKENNLETDENKLDKKIMSEYIDLQKNFNLLKSKITENNNIEINEKKQSNYINAYDIIIEGSSFYKPWIIKTNRIYKNKIDKIKKFPVVTIIGNFDKGKTFILSELSRRNFPSGFDVETPWVCIHYPKNEKESEFLNAILIDSAGFETPLDFNQDKEFSTLDVINDRTLSQDFHQKFLIHVSHLILIVVNKMTLTDQKQLKHLLDIIPDTKKVCIVHNFNHINSINDIENYIKRDIYGGFQRINSKILNANEPKKRFFVTENVNVFHCILANKGSEAGNFYNESTFEFLRETIKNLLNIKLINIENELISYLNQNKEIYCKNFEKLNFELIEDKNNDKFLIKNNSEEKIELKNLTFNPLLLLNQKTSLSHFIYSSKTHLFLRIMIPGIDESNVKQISISLKDIENEEEFRIIHIKIDLHENLKNYFRNLHLKICKDLDCKEITSQFNNSTKNLEFFTCEIPFHLTNSLNLENKQIKFNNGILEIDIPNLDILKSINFE